jgi:hypothetical protein
MHGFLGKITPKDDFEWKWIKLFRFMKNINQEAFK